MNNKITGILYTEGNGTNTTRISITLDASGNAYSVTFSVPACNPIISTEIINCINNRLCIQHNDIKNTYRNATKKERGIIVAKLMKQCGTQVKCAEVLGVSQKQISLVLKQYSHMDDNVGK